MAIIDRRPIAHWLIAPLISFALISCAAIREADEKFARHQQSAIDYADQLAQEIAAYQARRLTTVSDKIWIGGAPGAFAHSQKPLPESIRRHHDVSFTAPAPVSLAEAANMLADITGLAILPEAGSESVPPAPFRYRGALPQLLDALAASFGIHWAYDENANSIYLTRFLTRVFEFYAPPGQIETAASVTSDSAEDSSEERNISSSFRQSITTNEWENIAGVIKSALPEDSAIHLSPATGTITITTTPRAMRHASNIIRERNLYFTRQIHLAVQVLEVIISSEDKYGLDLTSLNASDLVKKAFGSNLDLNGLQIINDNRFAAAAGIVYDNGTADTPSTLKSAFDALSTLGKVSIFTTINTRARNGRSTPVQSQRSRSYLAEVRTTTNEHGITTDYIPDSFATGFFMNVRPRILAQEKIQLDMAISIDSLNELKSFGAAGTQIQQPDISTQSFTQETIIPNHATLVISGFEREENDGQKAGTFTPGFFGLGGAQEARNSRTMLVVLVTPTIIKL